MLIAEDVVARWYSITRGMSVEKPVTIQILRILLNQALLRRGHNPVKASQTVQSIIQGWAEECDGLRADHPTVQEVLEIRLAREL